MWDGVSIVVGIIIGMIIATLIFWFLFWTRSAFYQICPSVTPVCLYDQYWNDPGNALASQNPAQPISLPDILFINNKNGVDVMMYKRVSRNAFCVPDSNTQTVPINNPQFCSFTTTSGQTFEGQNSSFESPLYTGSLTISGTTQNIDVLTDGNCQPIRSQIWGCNPETQTCDIVSSGAQVQPVKWLPNTSITTPTLTTTVF